MFDTEMMESSDSKNKGPRACTTCAKAKSRCIPGPAEQEKCERCHRLGKTCGQQTPAPPRAKKEPKTTKVAQLEKRLDDLTTQLQAAQQGGGFAPPPNRPTKKRFMFRHLFPEEGTDFADAPEPQAGDAVRDAPPPHLQRQPSSGEGSDAMVDTEEELPSPLEPHHQHPDTHPHQPHAPPPQQQGYPTPTTSSNHTNGNSPVLRSCDEGAPSTLWPLPAEAEALLAEYRRELAALFPFVIIPGMSAEEMMTARPFLWKATMMAAVFADGVRQIALAEDLLKEIGHSALRKPTDSLDLLQGLEVLVAWYHYNINSFQLTNLLFLARSICVNLEFRGFQVGLLQNDRAMSSKCLEQMRALLGCYYLNTMVFTTNKRPDVLMHTTSMDVCCGFVEQAAEHPSDVLLVKLVRIQQLAQSVSLTLAVDSVGLQTMQVPLIMVVQSFQQQLDSFRSSLSPDLLENSTLMSHVAVVEVLLTEIAISDPKASFSLTDRLQLLWSCLTAAKTFLTIRFSRTLIEELEPRFICITASDLLYVFLTCLKLITLSVPGWNQHLVRKQLSFSQFIDTQIQELETITRRRKRYNNLSNPVLPGAYYPPGTPCGGASSGTGSGMGGGSCARNGDGPISEDPFERLNRTLKHFRLLLRREVEGEPDEELLPDVSPAALSTPESTPTRTPTANGAGVGLAANGNASASVLGGVSRSAGLATELEASFWDDLLREPTWAPFEPPLATGMDVVLDQAGLRPF